MNNYYPAKIVKLISLLGLFLLLNGCVQSTAQISSSVATTQLKQLQKQQRQNTTQLNSLQQQIEQLQQQLIDNKIIVAGTSSPKKESPVSANSSQQYEAVINYHQDDGEAAGIAASAASYLAAFSHLAADRPLKAETGFEAFLKSFPNHQYTPNARYWLANAQLSQGKTEQAQVNLQQLATDPKAKAKVPAALLQLAEIYRQDGKLSQANNVLEQLRNHYPDSPEAQQFYQSTEPKD